MTKANILSKIDQAMYPEKHKHKVRLFLTDWLEPQATYYKSCYVPNDVFRGEDNLFSNWAAGYEMIIKLHCNGESFIETPTPTVPDEIRMYPTGSEPPEPGE